MAKNIRTSGNYTIRSGTGSSGTTTLNLAAGTIDLDSTTVKIRGNLQVDGTQTVIDSQTLEIEDAVLVLARNNSGTDIDSGIKIDRGGQGNDALFYWNEGDDTFKAVTSATQTSTQVTDTALANIMAATPTNDNHVATRGYVLATAGFKIAGDDSTVISVNAGATSQFKGTGGITTVASEPDTLTISLGRDLSGITSITSDASNGNLELKANGTGHVVINDTLTFSGMASDPTATTQTKVYNKTAGGGGTGLYFRNSNIGSGAVGELISKSKATALAIALG
jgi:hypothetical protein|tara:strand:+ start:203 stop:1045 length:843 start_codon:yes stop_codon:yes gene_type:complete